MSARKPYSEGEGLHRVVPCRAVFAFPGAGGSMLPMHLRVPCVRNRRLVFSRNDIPHEVRVAHHWSLAACAGQPFSGLSSSTARGRIGRRKGEVDRLRRV